MPPNRKGAFNAVDTLSTLDVSQFVETSKFQPLTTETEPAAPVQQQQQQEQQDRDASPTTVALSSPQQDDPVKKAIIERILTEERLRQQFSADHIIQSNLPQGNNQEKTIVVQRKDNDDDTADDYWAEAQPKETDLQEAFTIRSKNQDPSYWEWKTLGQQQEKDALVQRILQEERLRQLFSVEHVEQAIVNEAAKLQQKGVTPAELLPQNDAYWNWESEEHKQDDADVVLQAQDKQGMIQEILQAEKIRQQFSVEHIEQNLVQENSRSQAASESQAVASNDDYLAGF